MMGRLVTHEERVECAHRGVGAESGCHREWGENRKVSMRLCTLKISLQLIQQRVYPQLNQESKRVLLKRKKNWGEWQQRVGIVDAMVSDLEGVIQMSP